MPFSKFCLKINSEVSAIEAAGDRIKDLDLQIDANAQKLGMELTAFAHPGVQVVDFGETSSKEEIIAVNFTLI